MAACCFAGVAMSVIYASARFDKLRTVQQVKDAIEHATRGPGARYELRPGAVPGAGRRGVIAGEPEDFDLMACLKAHKLMTGARERASAPMMLHVLLWVSPQWVKDAGDLHDPENPRNKQLSIEAMEFVGKRLGGVIASRLDLDEAGGAVVDVFCAPVRQRQGRLKKDGTHGPGVMEISVNKALTEMRDAHRDPEDHWETEALQTTWAKWAQERLDPAIQRGERAKKTGRVHLETPDYKLAQDALANVRGEIENAAAEKVAVSAELDSNRTLRDAAAADVQCLNTEVAALKVQQQVQKEVFEREIAKGRQAVAALEEKQKLDVAAVTAAKDAVARDRALVNQREKALQADRDSFDEDRRNQLSSIAALEAEAMADAYEANAKNAAAARALTESEGELKLQQELSAQIRKLKADQERAVQHAEALEEGSWQERKELDRRFEEIEVRKAEIDKNVETQLAERRHELEAEYATKFNALQLKDRLIDQKAAGLRLFADHWASVKAWMTAGALQNSSGRPEVEREGAPFASAIRDIRNAATRLVEREQELNLRADFLKRQYNELKAMRDEIRDREATFDERVKELTIAHRSMTALAKMFEDFKGLLGEGARRLPDFQSRIHAAGQALARWGAPKHNPNDRSGPER
jgi:hypothetical protein